MRDILLIEGLPSGSDGTTATEPGQDGPAKPPNSTFEIRLSGADACQHSSQDQPGAEATRLPTATITAAMEQQMFYARQAYRHWGINE